QKVKLEGIITPPHPSEFNKTMVGRLKEPSCHTLPETFLKIIELLEYIRGMDFESVKVSHLHSNLLLQLSRLGTSYEAYSFRDFQLSKRHMNLTSD
ncbi:hypothetical protein B1143_00060, partial [Enterococcus faecium]